MEFLSGGQQFLLMFQQDEERSIWFYGPGNERVGRLFIKEGAIHFEGKADESANAFFEALRLTGQRGWWSKLV